MENYYRLLPQALDSTFHHSIPDDSTKQYILIQQKHRKMKAKRSSKRRRSSPDIISTLPQTIIEAILCLLPIKEAARTSILSREWRYKWTTIPKLVFNEYVSRSNLLCAVRHVLLLRHDPIHEFTLVLDDYSGHDYTLSDIDQILLYLSKNHALKRLALELNESSSYNLPSCVCNGFGSLTSLSLAWVTMRSETLLQFLSNCPLLKNFSLFMIIDNFLGHKLPTMVELFECLPVIERLTIFGDIAELFVPDLVMQELPTSLVHLKYFCVQQLQFFEGKEMTFLAVLIKCSPNLEKIEIEMNVGEEEIEGNILEEYCSDVWLEHLTELKIKYYCNSKPELEFVKFILARSPKLKKVSIRSHVNKHQEPEMLKTLLRTPRASPVQIDVF